MIRRLIAADAVAFRALRLEALGAHPSAYGSTLADWADQPLSRFEARLAGSTVLGAFAEDDLEGDLIGIAGLDRERGGNACHRALITMVYVRAGNRRNGAATGLMAALADLARAEGVLQLELSVAVDNPAAVAAYAKAGFQIAGTMPRAILSGRRFIDEHLMVRFLDLA